MRKYVGIDRRVPSAIALTVTVANFLHCLETGTFAYSDLFLFRLLPPPAPPLSAETGLLLCLPPRPSPANHSQKENKSAKRPKEESATPYPLCTPGASPWEARAPDTHPA